MMKYFLVSLLAGLTLPLASYLYNWPAFAIIFGLPEFASVALAAVGIAAPFVLFAAENAPQGWRSVLKGTAIWLLAPALSGLVWIGVVYLYLSSILGPGPVGNLSFNWWLEMWVSPTFATYIAYIVVDVLYGRLWNPA